MTKLVKAKLTVREKRDKYLMAKYGVGIEYYERRFKEQGNACAICKRPPKEGKNLNLDHNHETGEVRGLLCFICNKILLGRLERGSKTCRVLIEGLYEYSQKYRLRGDV